MSRADQYNVTVSINWPGLGALGTFDTFSGGEVDSEEQKYAPGGMAAEITLGGRKSVGNVTVGRLFSLARDHALVPRLIDAAGKADMTIGKQSLDTNGNAFGRPLVYTGKLKAVTPPDHDSTSSDPALIELEMSSASVA